MMLIGVSIENCMTSGYNAVLTQTFKMTDGVKKVCFIFTTLLILSAKAVLHLTCYCRTTVKQGKVKTSVC